MNRKPILRMRREPTKIRMIIFAVILLFGCTAGNNGNQKLSLETLKIGDSVYVCGCPMMCCNSISRLPGGRCVCNMPLKRGTVWKIQDGKVYVNVSSRQKVFLISGQQ